MTSLENDVAICMKAVLEAYDMMAPQHPDDACRIVLPHASGITNPAGVAERLQRHPAVQQAAWHADISPYTKDESGQPQLGKMPGFVVDGVPWSDVDTAALKEEIKAGRSFQSKPKSPKTPTAEDVQAAAAMLDTLRQIGGVEILVSNPMFDRAVHLCDVWLAQFETDEAEVE